MTHRDCHIVLVVVHTVTLGQRLLDVVRLVESDPRIKIAFTAAPGRFDHEVDGLLRYIGAVIVPWEQATRHEFGLAIAPSETPGLVRTPLIVMPNGAGCNRLVNCGVSRWGTGSRTAHGAGSRRSICNSGVVPAAIALAHEAERVRLTCARPEALPVASVVGDSSYDRLVASLPLRGFYRRALGVGPGQKLVVVASRWGPWSLFWQRRDLMFRLLAELSSDEYRVLALLHPTVWSSRRRTGLAEYLRGGLSLMPAESDWRAPLVAADWIISDHGPVAPYGAVTGGPVLLVGLPDEEIDPASSVAELAKIAPRLSSQRSICAQLHDAAEEHRADRYQAVIERITSEPGRFNANMRRLMYRLLRLRQPATIPTTDPVSPPFRIE